MRLQGRAERAELGWRRTPEAPRASSADLSAAQLPPGSWSALTRDPCTPGAACRLRPRGATAASARIWPRQPTAPAGHRNDQRQARAAGTGHPPSAPALSRPRSPSRARAALASFGWRCAPLWTVIFLGTLSRLSVGWPGVGVLSAARSVRYTPLRQLVFAGQSPYLLQWQFCLDFARQLVIGSGQLTQHVICRPHPNL